MAIRDKNHSIGDIAASSTKSDFEKYGYAVNDILKDYGEDFFVVTHDNETNIVEPARIFVQSKGTRSLTNWGEYVDPLTVRNWVSGNELVIVVKRNIDTDKVRYCIPEEDYSYFEIVDFIVSKQKVPINCKIPFTEETPQQLIWAARIRHYERMILLNLPDNVHFQDVPAARWIALELLGRCGLVNSEKFVPSDASLSRLNGKFFITDELFDSENMTKRQLALYTSWVAIITNRLNCLSPETSFRNSFIEHLAIVMQIAGKNYGLYDDDFDYHELDGSVHCLWNEGFS